MLIFLHHVGDFRTGEFDGEQTVLQARIVHLHPVSQHENALELTRGDTAIEVVALFLILLAPTESPADYPPS